MPSWWKRQRQTTPTQILAFILVCISSLSWNGSTFALVTPLPQPRGPAKSSRHHSSATDSLGSTSLVDSDDDDNLSSIQRLTEQAILQRGTNKGFEALGTLAKLCQHRQPFDYSQAVLSSTNQSKTETRASPLVVHMPQILPRDIATSMADRVKKRLAHREGWMSDNPDSVDGLPSGHVSLIAGGKPIISKEDVNGDEYANTLYDMTQLVSPIIYETLLPRIRELLDDDTIVVDEVFVRHYGAEYTEEEEQQQTRRRGLSAHYDVQSRVTSVLALDGTARDGRNGLYTTAASSKAETASGSVMASGHTAFRRYFPLNQGDGVVHTWDVLHGVQVEPGVERASLIVWFTSEAKPDSCIKTYEIPCWLQADEDRLANDDVNQFVLASALESSNDDPLTISQAVDWYLTSARKGNPFAYTRLGGACADEIVSQEQQTCAIEILNELFRDDESIRTLTTGKIFRRLFLPQAQSSDGDYTEGLKEGTKAACQCYARQFWWAASLMGNPLAQSSLANSIMEEASNDPQARLLAGVLFGLAAQQQQEQDNEGLDALTRVVELEMASGEIASQAEFEASPLVMTCQIACSCLAD